MPDSPESLIQEILDAFPQLGDPASTTPVSGADLVDLLDEWAPRARHVLSRAGTSRPSTPTTG